MGWKDNKGVYLASNLHGCDPPGTIGRFQKVAGGRLQVPCPDLVKHYNKGRERVIYIYIIIIIIIYIILFILLLFIFIFIYIDIIHFQEWVVLTKWIALWPPTE